MKKDKLNFDNISGKVATISQIDQENYIKTILEGGAVQVIFDEDKCKFNFKYISKVDMIKPITTNNE